MWVFQFVEIARSNFIQAIHRAPVPRLLLAGRAADRGHRLLRVAPQPHEHGDLLLQLARQRAQLRLPGKPVPQRRLARDGHAVQGTLQLGRRGSHTGKSRGLISESVEILQLALLIPVAQVHF